MKYTYYLFYTVVQLSNVCLNCKTYRLEYLYSSIFSPKWNPPPCPHMQKGSPIYNIVTEHSGVPQAMYEMLSWKQTSKKWNLNSFLGTISGNLKLNLKRLIKYDLDLLYLESITFQGSWTESQLSSWTKKIAFPFSYALSSENGNPYMTFFFSFGKNPGLRGTQKEWQWLYSNGPSVRTAPVR